ncbi:hypothetical protein FRACA_1650012 [Frankia canadensis]|uniref:Carrier domain-containing protein n=1 Tax=Frankia canadensis TaxID=1836972 RepID=A0A2I2KMV3_9ACTN|nr:hypothetical protein FRACA_1650012 [Frankia canadensis]SOU54276.1 hypothetical protein FRACA_1650012 [Frankia canadensis]
MLGVEKVGLDDDFFTLGGDSIIAMRLITRVRAAGFTVTPRLLFGHRTPATLATVVRPRRQAATQTATARSVSPAGPTETVLPPTPALQAARVHGMNGGRLTFASFSSPVLLRTPAGLDLATMVAGLSAVIDQHDALRGRLVRVESGGADGGPAWSLAIAPPGGVDAARLVRRLDAGDLAAGDGFAGPGGLALLAGVAAAANAELDPDRGEMIRAVWLDAGASSPGRLLLLVHHALIDGVSWPTVLDDLAAAVTASRAGERARLTAVPVPFAEWARRLDERARAADVERRLPFWQDLLARATPVRWLPGQSGPSSAVTVSLPPERAAGLLSTVPAVFGIGVDELLLAALSLAVGDRQEGDGAGGVLVAVQAHGRQEYVVEDRDLSRTVGWLAEVHPFLLERGAVDEGADGRDGDGYSDRGVDAAVARVRALMAEIPDGGTEFSMLRFLNPRTAPILAAAPTPTVYLNYVGRLGRGEQTDWSVAAEDEELFADWNADVPDPFGLSVIVRVLDGPHGPELTARWSSGPDGPPAAVVRDLAAAWTRALSALAARAARVESTPPTGAGGAVR